MVEICVPLLSETKLFTELHRNKENMFLMFLDKQECLRKYMFLVNTCFGMFTKNTAIKILQVPVYSSLVTFSVEGWHLIFSRVRIECLWLSKHDHYYQSYLHRKKIRHVIWIWGNSFAHGVFQRKSEIKKCAIFNKTFFFPCIEWVKVPQNVWLYLRIQLSVYKAFRRHLLGLIVGRPVLD